jgi:copper transport protein
MTRLIARLASLLLVLCLATSASAHAVLVASEPGDGSVVAQAPKTVQLRFNESVTPAAVTLIDANGKAREVTISAVDQSVVVALPDALPRGTQIVSYRVVSQDGHPVAGSLVFSIGVVTGAAPQQVDYLVAGLIWLTRIGVYLGLFAGVGGVFFAAWIAPGPAGEWVIFRSLRIGLASAVVSLGLQGIDLLNLPLYALVTPAPWLSALGTSLGPSLLIAIAAMLIARIAWRSPTMTIAWVLTAASMLGVGLSLATSGHAATASPGWLTRPVLFLHGVCIAYWVGALAPLATRARRQPDLLPPILHRFSAGAVPIVALLVLSGLVLSVIQLQSVHALIDTSYGIILSIKLALVLLLLGLAALNRFWLTPALAKNYNFGRELRGSIILECFLVIAILAVVAGWRFTPPPRALAVPAEAPLAIHIHTDAAMFQVLISPGQTGANAFVLQLMQGDASPLQAKEATLTLSLPERGIEPLERSATLGPDGYWHLRDVPLPLPGRWHMRIDALVTDFQRVTLEDDFEVR